MVTPQPLALLAMDAMTGAGNLATGWRTDTNGSLWRFDEGLVCEAGAPCEHVAKWNFAGVGVVLWAPRGLPGAGNTTISIDGDVMYTIDLSAPSLVPSAPVWSSEPLPPGRHACIVRTAPGIALPVDSVDVVPEPVQSL
jgi:hypothetical protein